jgi:hypothetical protein
VRQAMDTALLSIIGFVNQMVFTVSKGRVVLYRFQGAPGVLLTVTGSAASLGGTVIVHHFTDGDDYIVLAAEAETRLLAALRTATAVTLTDEEVPADIIMLTSETERAALLKSILKHISIYARHEVRQRRQVPIARLAPHCRPALRSSLGSIRFP